MNRARLRRMIAGLLAGGGGAAPSTLLDNLAWWFDFDEVSDGSVPVSRVDSLSADELTDNNTVASETVDSELAAKFVTTDSTMLTHADGAKWRFGNNTFTVVGRVQFVSHSNNRGVITKGNEFVFYNVSASPRILLYSSAPAIIGDLSGGVNEWTTAGQWYAFRCGFDKVQGRVFLQLGNGIYWEKDVTGTPASSTAALQVGAFLTANYLDGYVRNLAKYDRLLTYPEWYQLSTVAPAPTYPFAGLAAGPAAPTYTATTQGRASLTNFETAIGAGYAKILLIGDSWMERPDIPARLRAILQTEYGDGGIGYYSFLDSSDSTDTRISSVSQTGTWTQVGATGYGIDISHVSITNTATLNWTATFDRIVLHFRQVSGGGTFKYQIDGGGYTNVDTDGATAYQTVVITGLANSAHTVNVEWVSGAVILFGAEMTSGATGVVVYKCGHTGARADQWADVDGTNWTAAAAAFDPDLCLITLGTNDQSLSVTPAAYSADLQTLFARLPATCDILMAPSADGGRKITVPYPYDLYEYAEAIYLAGGWDAFFDGPGDFGPYGYTFKKATSWWESNIHLSVTAGGYAWADLIIAAFLTGW